MKFILPALLVYLLSCTAEDEVYPSDEIILALSSSSVEMPTELKDTFLFQGGDPSKPHVSQIAYDVKNPLWTDGATKKRYIFVPPDSTVGYDEDQKMLIYPLGTTFTKHFSDANGSPIETRVMTRKDNGQWYFATYVWEGATVAKINTFPRTVNGTDDSHYRIPSEKECKMCHAAGEKDRPVLGAVPKQVSENADSIITRLSERGVTVDGRDKIAEIKTLPDFEDEAESIETRVRAYMDVNCSHCHQPDGAAYKDSKLDLRFSTPISETNLLAGGIVSAGAPDKSKLWQKWNAKQERMPPLSLRPDPMGEKLIKKWIEGLE